MPTELNIPINPDMRSFLEEIHKRSYHPLQVRFGAMRLYASLVSPDLQETISQAVTSGFLECERETDGVDERVALRLTDAGRKAIGAVHHVGLLDRLTTLFSR